MTDRKLYQRLGISAAEITAALDCFRPIADGRELGVDVAFSRTLWILARMQMVLGHFLLDERAASRWQATLLVAEVEEYLFGPWRDDYTVTRWVEDSTRTDGGYQVAVQLGRDGCRRELGWQEQFRDGLCCALSLSQWDAAVRIAAYPVGDVLGRDRVGSAYDRLLGRLITGDFVGWDEDEDVIRKERKKGVRLLLAAMAEIRQARSTGLEAALRECIRHHARADLSRPGLDNKMAISASILYHAGRRAGISVELGDQRDYLLSFD